MKVAGTGGRRYGMFTWVEEYVHTVFFMSPLKAMAGAEV